MSKADKVTIVADRESDIYEEWARLPDERTHLLTRACRDRTLATGGKLYGGIDAQPVQGIHRFEAPARPGKRSAHQATLEVRFGRITIKRPASCSDKNAPKQIELSVVEVKELPSSVVGDEAPIHWRLPTTHRIECLEDALQCVDWHRQRWNIEQLFRTLKKQGLNVESSQVETGESLTKLICLATHAAVRTMQLTLARDANSSAQASDVFDPEEIDVMQRILPTLEGETEKQKKLSSSRLPCPSRMDRCPFGRMERICVRSQARPHHHAARLAACRGHLPGLETGYKRCVHRLGLREKGANLRM
ncbi:MAG: IS4 family transposase [Methylobacter sp.]